MQPLPSPWVDALFAKLSLAYGVAFQRQYDGLDPDAVKAEWASTLAPLRANPKAIAYGLDNLAPDKPPTAMQFRAICNRRPDAPMVALPAPVAEPSPEVAAKVAEIARSAGVTTVLDPLAWARRLKAREQADPGRHGLTRSQREMWRTALREESPA